MNERRLYRIPEVAEYLSVSRSKVYELVRSGVLPSIKIDGIRRVRGDDVIALVETHRIAAS
jgi:excisionase family DNA binding protein